MLRPSPNHGKQRLPNDDDDDFTHISIVPEMVLIGERNTIRHSQFNIRFNQDWWQSAQQVGNMPTISNLLLLIKRSIFAFFH